MHAERQTSQKIQILVQFPPSVNRGNSLRVQRLERWRVQLPLQLMFTGHGGPHRIRARGNDVAESAKGNE